MWSVGGRQSHKASPVSRTASASVHGGRATGGSPQSYPLKSHNHSLPPSSPSRRKTARHRRRHRHRHSRGSSPVAGTSPRALPSAHAMGVAAPSMAVTLPAAPTGHLASSPTSSSRVRSGAPMVSALRAGAPPSPTSITVAFLGIVTSSDYCDGERESIPAKLVPCMWLWRDALVFGCGPMDVQWHCSLENECASEPVREWWGGIRIAIWC